MGPRKNIIRSWHEWEIDGRQRRLILVIETDLEMNPEEDRYDSDLLEELRIAAVTKMHGSCSPIDIVRIVPERG